MFADSPCRPTIAVRDKAKAIGFYRDVLGFKLVDADQPGATFACGGGTFLEIYPSEFAATAKNTVAGFEVPDLEKAISELRSRGVNFEEYESPKTIDGIAHLGPNRGAWFKDPDGSILRWSSAVRRSRAYGQITPRLSEDRPRQLDPHTMAPSCSSWVGREGPTPLPNPLSRSKPADTGGSTCERGRAVPPATRWRSAHGC